MHRQFSLKTFVLLAICITIAVPALAQWATPTVDGFIANGEYGTNNQLNNAATRARPGT